MKRFLLLLVALLACGLIAAGCGDDDDDDGDDSPVATETEPAEPTETTDADEADDDTPPVDDATIEQAVEACKESVRSSGGQLSDDLVSDLEDLCEEAAGGDEDDLREASREICRRVVEETVPEGPARDQALETCEQTVPTE